MPQSDGNTKLRPALLLRKMPSFNDFLVCGISTKLHHLIENFDEIVSDHDKDFAQSGLAQPSLIRLGFLAVIPSRDIAGSIGSISETRHKRLLRNLATYINKK